MSVTPMNILTSIAGVTKGQNGSADLPIKIAKIDPAYVASSYPGVLPKVTFEGETTLSGKFYTVMDPYSPKPNDRVVMVPIGTTYTIIGSIQSEPLEARIAALETAVAASRWRHIAAGSKTTTGQQSLTVPAGFTMLRLAVYGKLNTGAASIAFRLNSDSTESYQWGHNSFNAGSGTVLFEHYGDVGLSKTSNRIGEWTSVDGCNAVVNIWPVDGSDVVSYLSYASRPNTTGSAHRRQLLSGIYTKDDVVTSIQIIEGSNTFAKLGWTLEGYLED
jgi:hypothetical protein